ncbi:DUF4326 domain-containing protein [Arthrobacter sp. UYCu712]|uniref:DUF4326 domain-containing protein n=1 Tax=Arthrobacter sp. UYCu712 TaxID=3156340 RepID=UPI003391B579
MTPGRVQRKRTKGWRMPENTAYVGRGSKWGNLYHSHGDPGEAVRLFSDMLQRAPLDDQGRSIDITIRAELAGKNLACWCPLDKACHADLLLELANKAADDMGGA